MHIIISILFLRHRNFPSYMTAISRSFCNSEFILDTGHLIRNLHEINNNDTLRNDNINLFTLDVESLYPSINPTLAMEAINYALQLDTTTDKKHQRCNKILCQTQLRTRLRSIRRQSLQIESGDTHRRKSFKTNSGHILSLVAVR